MLQSQKKSEFSFGISGHNMIGNYPQIGGFVRLVIIVESFGVI